MASGFKPNDVIVHPHHGIGTVGKLVDLDIGGQSHRFLMLDFSRTGLTLRIPEGSVVQSGLRPVSSKQTMESALALLTTARVALPGHWSRWADAYAAKLNSGQPDQLAEVVRDLTPSGSSWKAKLYEEAVLRLAEELAIIEHSDIATARRSIEERLPPELPRRSASPS